MKPIKIIFLSLIVLYAFDLGDKNQGRISNDEVIRGLKDALKVGTENSTIIAHKYNGYYSNAKIKISFPPNAGKVEGKIRSMGMGYLVDTFIIKINRAAEHAAVKAKDIFLNAIVNMSFNDAMGILNGGNNAATLYLRSKTYNDLKLLFKPDIQKSLSDVGAVKAWNAITSAYNKIPFVSPVNTDLPEYATQKALDGLFILLADEELKIRKDPVARVTDILKKVFGGF